MSYYQLAFLLTFFLSSFAWADPTPTATISPLKVQILQNGGIRLFQRGKMRMIETEACVYTENWKQCYFKHTDSEPGLNGVATLPDGTQVRVDSSVELIPSGVHLIYTLSPSKETKVLDTGILITLNYTDWTGKNHQNYGNDSQPATLIAPNYGVSFSFNSLGNIDNLTMTCQPKDRQQFTYKNKDNNPVYWIRCNRVKTKDDTGLWKAGDKKTFDLSLFFTAPVEMEKPADPQKADILEANSQYHDGDYLFVSGKLKLQSLSKPKTAAKEAKGWFVWDTGTHVYGPNPSILVVTNPFVQKLGFKLSEKNNLGETLDGPKKFTYISNHPTSSVGPIAVQMNIGDLDFKNTGLMGVEIPFLDKLNDYNFIDKTNDIIIGIVPFDTMQSYLFSMDYLNEKIYLRPLDSARRTFFDQKPLAETDFILRYGFVYCPVTINKTFKGYMLFDSGNDSTNLDESKTHIPAEKITSFMIGDYEIMPSGSTFKPQVAKNPSKFLTPKEQDVAVGNIGNDLLKYMFTTVDPVNQKIYFESKP